MNSVVFRIVALAVVATGFYTFVGQIVPQERLMPPTDLVLDVNMSTDEMIEVGQKIAESKGQCLVCHLNTSRYPDLAGVGQRAQTRIPSYSDVDYFAESLYDPEKYLVEGFAGGMPAINKPPIGLTDDEILCMIAWLQSKGGTPTVTMESKHFYNGGPPPGSAGADAAEGEEAVEEAHPGREVFDRLKCGDCHNVDGPGEGGLGGPGLFDSGVRLDNAAILNSLFYPQDPAKQDAMSQAGLGQATQEDTKLLVDYLLSLRGEQ